MSMRVHPRDLADYLIGRGERFVTTERVAELLGVRPERVSRSLTTARRDRKMVSVTKGAWVPVEARWRRMGTQPITDFIGDLMRHSGHAYHLGYRTAAAEYGVSHHSWGVCQVVVDTPHRSRRIGDVPVQFIRSSRVGKLPTHIIRCGDGSAVATTPEATVFDLVERPLLGGGLDYVATTIGGMITFGLLDGTALARVADLYPHAVAQRVGHLVAFMQDEVGWVTSRAIDLTQLAELVASRAGNLVTLSVGTEAAPTVRSDSEIHVDERWRLRLDYEIEHDL